MAVRSGGTKDTWTYAGKKLLSQLAALRSKPYVKVGVLQVAYDAPKTVDGTGKNAKPAQFAKIPSLGDVAVWNEFGTSPPNKGVGKFGPVHGTPERSFIRSTFDENVKVGWKEYADELRKAIINGQIDTDKALGLMGQRIKRDTQAKIRSNIPPPNAQSTIDAKGGKDKTLINTGQLLNSIDYEVHRKGDDK